MDLDYDHLIKILVVGDASVGKSCLMSRFDGISPFDPNTLSTIGVDFKILNREMKIKDEVKQIKVQIWDTAGQERFRSITESYYRCCDGIVLCFDLTNEKSFFAIKEWYDSIMEMLEDDMKDIPIMLVGNKSDLTYKRVISEEEGKKMSEELQLSNYIETSAKDNSNVKEMFEEMINITVAHNVNQLEKRKKEFVDDFEQPIKLKDDKKKSPFSFFANLCKF